jgi:hypothetical protein
LISAITIDATRQTRRIAIVIFQLRGTARSYDEARPRT